jgi:hypothetical protein
MGEGHRAIHLILASDAHIRFGSPERAMITVYTDYLAGTLFCVVNSDIIC